jgi:energy-coupling factor transporter ATP-binding protein EcfA2
VRELVDRTLLWSGRRLDLSQPFVDAQLPDGSRLHVVIPEITAEHWAVNIRKHLLRHLNLDDLARIGLMSEEIAAQLSSAVKCGLNILVSGGTQAGKTTLLNALASAIPLSQRVITIEEVFKKNSPINDCYAMSEILFEFLMCYSGKSKVIPELMTLRSGENIGFNSLNPDENISFNFFNKKIDERLDYWWLDKNNKLKKDQLINFVKLCCKKIDSINKNIFSCNVENIFENYVKFLQKEKKPFYIYFKSLYRYFPLFLRNNVKELLKYFGYFEDNLKKTNILKSINLLKKKKIRVDLNQLKNIDKILKNFYNYKLLK